MSHTRFTTGMELDSKQENQPDGTNRRKITAFILVLEDMLFSAGQAKQEDDLYRR